MDTYLYEENTPLIFSDGTEIYNELKKNISHIIRAILYMAHLE